jgi:hypothetical protein
LIALASAASAPIVPRPFIELAERAVGGTRRFFPRGPVAVTSRSSSGGPPRRRPSSVWQRRQVSLRSTSGWTSAASAPTRPWDDAIRTTIRSRDGRA